MQQAIIPYRSGRSTSWLSSVPPPRSSSPNQLSVERPRCDASSTANSRITGCSGSNSIDGIRRLVSETPVLVLGRRGCCMCHVVRRLLLGLGVNPAVCDLEDDGAETTIAEELSGTVSASMPVQFPAVFIGGKYIGGLDRLMAAHISGELIPILKEAGALWL